jgi:hypothetical protein
MPFHIEVAASRRHARSFNLTEEELGRTVLDPWLSDRPILLGDRKWKRGDEDSRLRILEGPELSVQDLAFSQGWANAERSSSDVTITVLEAATEGRRTQRGPATLIIHSDSPVQTLAEIVSGHDSETVSPEQLRERIDGRDPAVAAVILVVQRD